MQDISYQCRVASPKEVEAAAHKLKEHTEKELGMPLTHEPFGLFAQEGGKVIGSVVGKVYFNWLHIDLFWVEDSYRGKGIGRRLMEESYAQAAKMGLSGIEVWTQSWQAPEFYRKIGYEEFAVIDDFTPGRKRHAFRRKVGA